MWTSYNLKFFASVTSLLKSCFSFYSVLITSWKSAPFEVCFTTLFAQLFLIPVGLHPSDICFFQRSVIPWRIVSSLRSTYQKNGLHRTYQVQLLLDMDGLGLFNTPAEMYVVAYAHAKPRFLICNTMAIIPQPLLLMTMLNHKPYHPFPCP
jgi:hypothetical protein